MGSNDTVAPVVLVLCRVTPAGDHVTHGRQRRETDMTSSSHFSVLSGSPFSVLSRPRFSFTCFSSLTRLLPAPRQRVMATQ
jgi:hypothetical protein